MSTSAYDFPMPGQLEDVPVGTVVRVRFLDARGRPDWVPADVVRTLPGGAFLRFTEDGPESWYTSNAVFTILPEDN